MATRSETSRLALQVLGVVVIMWLIDSAMDAWVFGPSEQTFWGEVLRPGGHELYIRSVMAACLVTASLVFAKAADRQRAARRQVEQERQRLTALFDHMTECFTFHRVIVDEQGKPVDFEFVNVNRMYEEKWGRRREEVIGKRASEVLPQATAAQLIELYEKVVETGRSQRSEHKLPVAGGETWFDMTIYLPEPGYLAVVAADIAARKEHDQERERLIRELAAKNHELEQFTHSVSHDLQSPLITVRGFLGVLRRQLGEPLAEPTAACMKRLDQAVDQMQSMLKALLDLSRVGRVIGTRDMVPFGDLAEQALALVAGRLLQTRIEATVAADMPEVKVDRQRLLTVLQNLLDNAIKFTAESPQPRIHLGFREETDEEGSPEVVWFVQDNGPGIEAGNLELVFEPFQRLGISPAEGSGLGLALARKIIEQHGGRIWAESGGKGRGTTFCFTLGA